MRFRFLSLLLFVASALISYHAFAQEVLVKRSTVIENYKGKPYYIHFVNKGETLAAIAKVYNVTIEELGSDNPEISNGLKADMVLRIPQKSVIAIPDIAVPNTQTQPPHAKQDEKHIEPAKPDEKQKVQVKPDEKQNYILYLVKKQETLYGISKQYNVSVDDIVKANPGFSGLKEGMEIRIPKKNNVEKDATSIESPTKKAVDAELNPGEVVVKTGETLYSIGKAHNVTVDELIDLNPQLSEGLKPGMVVKLHKTVKKTSANPIEKSNSAGNNKTIPGECYNADNIKNTYKVALILPFLLGEASAVLEAPEQKDPSEFETFNYFQFYAGFMLAADTLEKYGLNARIQVFDGDRLNDTLTIRQTMRKPGLDKMDLIVGPMFANSFGISARFAKKQEIGIINPLSRRENIVDRNPYVIKVQVSGDGIATKLSSFIFSKYPNASIVAVRNDPKELKSLFTDFTTQIKNGLANHSFRGSLQEITYSTDMMKGVAKKLKPNVKNIVIFFSNNKTNVPNFVSLLNPLSKSNDIILMGMDGWEDMELETEFLVNLNFHQVTSSYINYESEAVQQFITRFRNKYGAVPLSSKHAFLGYDIGMYFLTSLMNYGDKYMECLPYLKGNGLQYNFNFATLKAGDGVQNQNVTIVKLQDYKMVKVE